jgi:hypothetical protein
MKWLRSITCGLLALVCSSFSQFAGDCDGSYVGTAVQRSMEIKSPGHTAHHTFKPGDTVSMNIWVQIPCDADHQVWVSLDSGKTYGHLIAEYRCDTASMYRELPPQYDPGWNIKVPWVPSDLTDSTYQKVMFLVYCEECKHRITETNETTVINYRPASAVSRMKPIRTGSVSGRPQAYYSIRGRRVGPEHLWRSPVISPDGLHVLPFERKQ